MIGGLALAGKGIISIILMTVIFIVTTIIQPALGLLLADSALTVG